MYLRDRGSKNKLLILQTLMNVEETDPDMKETVPDLVVECGLSLTDRGKDKKI